MLTRIQENLQRSTIKHLTLRIRSRRRRTGSTHTKRTAHVSARMARAGVDNILYLTEKASQIADFQKAALAQADLRERLRTYGAPTSSRILGLRPELGKVVQ